MTDGAKLAAIEIVAAWERIDGEAMQAGQVEQSYEADVETRVRLIAEIIDRNNRRAMPVQRGNGVIETGEPPYNYVRGSYP